VTEARARPALTGIMAIPTRLLYSLCALSLSSLVLAGCDPKAASGAIGVQPVAKPGPDNGGVTPTLPPTVDPLHDPIDPVTPLPKDIDVAGSPLPWKLTDPAARGGCKCKLVCGPANDDRSKDCITMCEGTGC
jgi:hypothetical protein